MSKFNKYQVILLPRHVSFKEYVPFGQTHIAPCGFLKHSCTPPQFMAIHSFLKPKMSQVSM